MRHWSINNKSKMKTLVNNQNQKRHWWINNNNKKETLMDKK